MNKWLKAVVNSGFTALLIVIALAAFIPGWYMLWFLGCFLVGFRVALWGVLNEK